MRCSRTSSSSSDAARVSAQLSFGVGPLAVATALLALGGLFACRDAPVCTSCRVTDETSDDVVTGDGDDDVVGDGDGLATDADATGGDGSGDADSDVAHVCSAPVEVSAQRLWPEPGELFYLQVGLSGFALGESAITVWPDGDIVLVDVGNDSHADAIEDALTGVVGAMNGAGFPARPTSSVDHIVLTHHHADHTDGLADLLAAVTVSGRVVSRGYFDLVGVTEGTIASSCDALAARPGLSLPLCSGAAAPCDPASWNGTYPPTSCSPGGAEDVLSFDVGTGIRILAVNGFIGGDRYETEIGPFLTENNGENARSIVAVLEHGAFRMLVNGDLTGGGSDTDAVEGFYVARLAAVSDLDGLGVDVLHAGHHGRNTSSSQTWADALLPRDGRDRNVVMGVSEAHVRSPHSEVLDTLLSSSRLGAGRAWTTLVALFGSTDAALIDADGGHVLLRTFDGGAGYYVQAVSASGGVLATRRFDSVRACP